MENKIKCLWRSIKSRCVTDKKHPYFKKGIKMFPAWINDYESFYEYVTSLPQYNYDKLGHGSNKLSLDRINGKGNYEPENLRWATKRQQHENSEMFKTQKHFPTSPQFAKLHLNLGGNTQKDFKIRNVK